MLMYQWFSPIVRSYSALYSHERDLFSVSSAHVLSMIIGDNTVTEVYVINGKRESLKFGSS